MRYVVLCLLLCGCSAGGSLMMPGKTPREATLTALRQTIATNPSIPQVYGQCVVDFMDKRLTDDEMKRIDAARATGGQDATYQSLVPAAVATCVK